MKKRSYFVIYLLVFFLALSALTYLIHYFVFHDVRHIFIYMVGDLAFLPLEVLLVVVLVERILARRERQAKLEKLNMVVGAFFIEIGNRLLRELLPSLVNRAEVSLHLDVKGHWTRREFRKAADAAIHSGIKVNVTSAGLSELKTLLSHKREFLMTLLQNPTLLEHDNFTGLLLAVTHLDEELDARLSLDGLPEKDLEHLASDTARVFERLSGEWLNYVSHLKADFPFLFSLILRTHPFQEHPSALVK